MKWLIKFLQSLFGGGDKASVKDTFGEDGPAYEDGTPLTNKEQAVARLQVGFTNDLKTMSGSGTSTKKLASFLKGTAKGTGMIAMAKFTFPAYAVVSLSSALKTAKKASKLTRAEKFTNKQTIKQLKEEQPENWEDQIKTIKQMDKATWRRDGFDAAKLGTKVARIAAMAALIGGVVSNPVGITVATAALFSPLAVGALDGGTKNQGKVIKDFCANIKKGDLKAIVNPIFDKDNMIKLAQVAVPSVMGLLMGGTHDFATENTQDGINLATDATKSMQNVIENMKDGTSDSEFLNNADDILQDAHSKLDNLSISTGSKIEALNDRVEDLQTGQQESVAAIESQHEEAMTSLPKNELDAQDKINDIKTQSAKEINNASKTYDEHINRQQTSLDDFKDVNPDAVKNLDKLQDKHEDIKEDISETTTEMKEAHKEFEAEKAKITEANAPKHDEIAKDKYEDMEKAEKVILKN